MATHAQNIQNLRDAVYGEQVRESMIQLFEEDYTLVKGGIGVGTAVTDSTSPITGYVDGNVYLNSDTKDLFKCNGSIWVKVGNIRSIKDITTVESNLDDGLNVVTVLFTDNTTTTFNVKNGSKGSTGLGVADVVDNGDGSFNLKLEDGTVTPNSVATIKGDKGDQGIQGIQGATGRGLTSITSSDAGRNHVLSANFTDGTSNIITTLKDGADGAGTGDMVKATYDVNDNGIVDLAEGLSDGTRTLTFNAVDNKADKSTTLAGYGITDAVKTPTTAGTAGNALVLDTDGQTVKWGDTSSLVKSVKATEFDVSNAGQLSLNSSITNKIGALDYNATTDKGKALKIKNDGSGYEWGTVSGGGGARWTIKCTAGEYICITDKSDPSAPVYDEQCVSGTLLYDVEVAHTYDFYQHSADRSKISNTITRDIDKITDTVTLSYFTAYIDVTCDSGATVTATGTSGTYTGVPSGDKYIITVGDKGTYTVTITKDGATKEIPNITITTENERQSASFAFGYVALTCVAEFTGLDIICKKSDGTTYATKTNTSGLLTFTFAVAGDYTFSSTYDSKEYSVSATVVLGSTVSKTLQTTPDGETADLTGTEATDVQTWLKCAEIQDASITSISGAFGNASVLNTLLASDNANKYLARLDGDEVPSANWTTTICGNESYMTSIGMVDACANKLLSDTTWCNAICDSTYYKKVLNVNIPRMTNDTTPSGYIADGKNQSSDYYYAFDDDANTFWCSDTNDSTSYITFEFNAVMLAKKMYFKISPSNTSQIPQAITLYIHGSVDGTSYEDEPILTRAFTTSESSNGFSVNLPLNNTKFKKYKLSYSDFAMKNTNGRSYNVCRTWEIYGR